MLVQQQLFQRIKDLLPPHTSFVDEVADVLGISQDSVYRRVRGEKPLSLEETLVLCGHFKVSLDALAGAAGGSVGFTYNRLRTAADFEQYLAGMAHLLGLMQAADKGHILYGASDVAIFHYFGQPEHAAFKMFYWQQAVLNLPELQGKKFSPDLISDKALALGRTMYDRYYSVPSVEIWTAESSLTSVRQIGYYYDAGLFASKELALTVAQQLYTSLKNVARMAESDSKDDAGTVPFKLYESEIQIGNNTVLATVNDTRVTYVSYQTFNVMTTLNTDFCDDTDAFLRSLMRRSMLISGVSERQRNQFFARLLAPIEALLARIEGE
jgi:hypothetical protein